MASKAMEVRTRLISDAERFHRKEDNILNAAIETYNEHSANNKAQTATEINANKKLKATEGVRNQVLKADKRGPNKRGNKRGKEQHPSQGNKKKLKVLIVGDSQLRRVDESKLSNSHRDVEKRFQPGMRIGQAVDKTGKSNNNDDIIVHAATNNVASSTPEKLCNETLRT